jgi:hypothetical protein
MDRYASEEQTGGAVASSLLLKAARDPFDGGVRLSVSSVCVSDFSRSLTTPVITSVSLIRRFVCGPTKFYPPLFGDQIVRHFYKIDW